MRWKFLNFDFKNSFYKFTVIVRCSDGSHNPLINAFGKTSVTNARP